MWKETRLCWYRVRFSREFCSNDNFWKLENISIIDRNVKILFVISS